MSQQTLATDLSPEVQLERIRAVLYGGTAQALKVEQTDDMAMDLTMLLAGVHGSITGLTEKAEALAERALADGQIAVERPHVAHGPKGVPANEADADYLRSAARNIQHSRCMGSNLTRTVTSLLHEAADAVEALEP